MCTTSFFVEKLHKGLQVFLHSCGSRDSSEMDFEAINFQDLLTSIQRRSLQLARIPKYIKQKSSKKDNADDNNDNSERSNTKSKKNRNKDNRDRTDEEEPIRVNNPNSDPECLLPDTLNISACSVLS